ncbi:MAG: hypothetical protein WC768_04630 [Patescibacteria group bacterium]|jgi:hypothetical protein
MSYQKKLERAEAIVAEHNESAGDEGKVDWESFLAKLKGTGGTTEATLNSCTWEDLQECGLPKMLARAVAKVFRTEEGEGKKTLITVNKAQAMPVAELVEHYDPREADNPVGKRLAEITKDQPCIVFNADGTVNVEASTQLVNELRDNLPARETFVVDGRPQKVFRIGERPDQVADENPLWPGRMLRPNGDCDQTNRSWTGVPDEVRALIYLARTETNELNSVGVMEANAVLDLATGDNAADKIRQHFPKASVKYDELKAIGNLPSLKLARTGSSGSSAANQPFTHRNRIF